MADSDGGLEQALETFVERRTEIPKSLYEDMYFTIRLLAKSKRSVYLTGRCTIMCAVGPRAPRISA